MLPLTFNVPQPKCPPQINVKNEEVADQDAAQSPTNSSSGAGSGNNGAAPAAALEQPNCLLRVFLFLRMLIIKYPRFEQVRACFPSCGLGCLSAFVCAIGTLRARFCHPMIGHPSPPHLTHRRSLRTSSSMSCGSTVCCLSCDSCLLSAADRGRVAVDHGGRDRRRRRRPAVALHLAELLVCSRAARRVASMFLPSCLRVGVDALRLRFCAGLRFGCILLDLMPNHALLLASLSSSSFV